MLLLELLELELELELERKHVEAYIPQRAAFIRLHSTVTPHDLVSASYSHPMPLLVARLSHIRWHAAADATDHG